MQFGAGQAASDVGATKVSILQYESKRTGKRVDKNIERYRVSGALVSRMYTQCTVNIRRLSAIANSRGPVSLCVAMQPGSEPVS